MAVNQEFNLTITDVVTTDANLKFTQKEIDYLESFLTAHDRGGYYMALYNITGSPRRAQ